MGSGQRESHRLHLRRLPAILRPGDIALVSLVALVALVGTLSAFAVRLFEGAIEWLLGIGFRTLPEALAGWGSPRWMAFLLFPFAIGLVLGQVKRLIPKFDRAQALPLVIVSLAKRQGMINPLSTLLKSLGAILTLGAGGSLGREGPVVLLGGGIGSALGQFFRIRADWRNVLVAAGAGAAIATLFHAPVTGALFVLEIVLIQFTARSFALVALGSVVAAAVSRYLEGGPTIAIPAYQVESPWEIALMLGLGLAIAPLSRFYIALIYGSEELGQRIRHLPVWLKPALGGVLFGLVGLAVPQTLGTNFRTFEDALFGRLTLTMLVILLVGKFVAIALTSGSGWVGGVFTPALFVGAMAGGIYGQVAAALVPGLVPNPAVYAVVGMAAMGAGATQAPLTAITLLLEVTQDFRIALPAMVACGIAAVFSQRFSPYSVNTFHMPEHGVLLPWQVQDLRSLPVAAVMTREVHTVTTGMNLREVIAVMQRSRHGGYPVLDSQGGLAGMITLRDVREVPLDQRLTTPVAGVMKSRLVTLTPDQTLADAAIAMARHGIGRLPVIDPDQPTQMLGIISRSDILRAYPTEAAEPGLRDQSDERSSTRGTEKSEQR